jgi:cell division ATPase FtsA
MGYVVAIDLGTSKIVGMVAHKDGEGLSILAIEKESISSQIIRGYVNNVNELAFEIKRIIEKLEKKIRTPIRKINVRINRK